jgi:hypothetical protein
MAASIQARPFRLVGAAACTAVQGGAQAALAAWCAEWCPAMDAGVGDVVPAAAPFDPVQACSRDGKRMLWLAWGNALAPQLQQALFGGVTPLASRIAGQVLAALAGHLARVLLPANAAFPRAGAAVPAAPVDDDAVAFASGAVQFTVRLGDARLLCIVSAAAVDALAPVKAAAALPRLPVLAWRTALADVPVHLTIEAGRAEVGAGSLLHCAPGDVIRLDRHADAPLAVLAPGGAQLFHGFLGRAGDHTAVEVTQHF